MNILPLVIILLSHVGLLSRMTFTAWPEMLTYPYLFSSGFTLYKDFIMPYPPGLVLLLTTTFNLFGFTPEVLRLLTWVVILLADLLLYLNLRRITSSSVSFFFLFAYVFMQSFLEGNMLWFDFFTIIPLLLGFYFILKWLETEGLKYLFWVGLFLGLAVFLKQTALVYLAAFSFLYLSLRKKLLLSELSVTLIGLSSVFVPLILYLFATDSYREFWDWTILYPLTEWSKFPGYVHLVVPKRYILITTLVILPLFFSFVNVKGFLKDKTYVFAAFFLLAAIIAIYPRYSFFHLQPTIAFAMLLGAKVYMELSEKLRKILLLSSVGATFIIVMIVYPGVIGEGIRFFGEEEIKLSEQIRSETLEGDKIYLIGLYSSEYVFSKRLPPKKWSDNFGWYLEIPGVQEWTIEEFKVDPPKVVYRRIPSEGRWFDPGTYQPPKILDYIFSNYRKTGMTDSKIEIWKRD